MNQSTFWSEEHLAKSFSVAGLRKGLEDPRGNLMLTYLSMASHFKPKWLLWENVPGVLSSNRGLDFAALLQGMAELGYGFAYRVLDAQYFGVPQRRRRVFVVGCLGDWRSAAKVLFESESLCRDITPSRQEGKEVANCLTKSPSSHSGFNPARSEGNAVIVPTHARDGKEVLGTLTASYGTGGVDLETKPLVHNVPLALAENTIGRKPENGGNGNGWSEDVMYTLNSTGVHGINYDMRVRRLTPMECERLQGFPDNYTNIPNAPDTGRYKALGNSMAVPVMRWIGERIDLQK